MCLEKKNGIATEATDDNIMRRMYIACGITKAIDAHSEDEIVFFPLK